MNHFKLLTFNSLMFLGLCNLINAQGQAYDIHGEPISVHNYRTSQDQLNRLLINLNFNREVPLNSIDYDGSPYTQENFELAEIKTFGNKVFLTRYNAFMDNIQILVENDTVVLKNSKKLELKFIKDSKVYKTFNYINKNEDSTKGFLVVLKEFDSISLLKQEKVKFEQGKNPKSSYDKGKLPTFKKINNLYFFKLNNRISLLPLKRKSFVEVFPEHSSRLKSYIKKNKINLKKEEDLINVFKYISSLLDKNID